MLKIIRLLAKWILSRRRLISTLKSCYLEVINEELKRKCVASSSSKFYNSTSIHNRQGNKSSIRIGENSHVKGELMVMGYGGDISIGDYVYVGEGSKIWSAKGIFIGDNVLISHNVNIIDTNSHELSSVQRAKDFKALITIGPSKTQGNIDCASIEIGSNVWINFNCFISKGVKIGQGAIIAPGSVVLSDVPAWTVVAGNPAIEIKTLEPEE